MSSTVLYAALEKVMLNNPERTIDEYLSNGDIISISYRQLLEKVITLSDHLSTYVQAQDIIVFFTENSINFTIGLLAGLKLNAILAPVDSKMPSDQLQQCLADLQPKYTLVSQKKRSELRAFKGIETFIDLVDFVNPATQLPRVNITDSQHINLPNKPSVIMHTSGTNNSPKGVMLSTKNILFMTHNLCHFMPKKVIETVKVMWFFPNHHVSGFTINFFMIFLNGGRLGIINDMNPNLMRKFFSTFKPSLFPVVPKLLKVYAEMIKSNLEKSTVKKAIFLVLSGLCSITEKITFYKFNIRKYVFYPVHKKFGGRVKMIFSGGSALPVSLQKYFFKLGLPVVDGWGMTETGGCAISQTLVLNYNHLKRTPFRGLQTKLTEVNQDNIGLFWIKGPAVMMGYFNNPGATNEVLVDGWLKTGDLAKIVDGNITIMGRQQDVLVALDGKKYFLNRLEEVYADIEGIKELAIIPYEIDEEIVAVAILTPDFKINLKNLEAHSHSLTAAFKVRQVELEPSGRVKKIFIVEQLPMTSSLKIKKQLLLQYLKQESLSILKTITL
jgi:long-chain acyl-CoA synthetase